MSIRAKFSNFHDKIKLHREDEAYKDARIKDDSILADIKKSFKDAGYKVNDSFLQGSFSTSTAVKHPEHDFDIDRAIVISVDDAPEDPVEPKKKVLDVLEKRGFKNAKIKKPCTTADYLGLNLHIDIIIYRESNENYELAVGKKNSSDQNKEWSSSDPKGLRDWINDNSNYIGSSNSKLAQYKRVVRYLKRWRDNKFSESVAKKIYSIGLTIMAKEQFMPDLDNEGRVNDLESLRNTVNAMLNASYFLSQGNSQYEVQVYLPKSPYRDVFDGSSVDTGTQLYNKLTTLRNKLEKAIAEDKLKVQCEILQDIFGSDFEVPESDKSNTTKKVAYSSAGAVGTSQGA